jgi:hypothetical protein
MHPGNTHHLPPTDSWRSLFKSEEFSDFTIKCGPYEFKVHKAVICAQSEYFKAACRSNSFKEGDAKLITLDTSDEDDPSCDDPEAVKRMIHFFYHLDYEVQNPAAADLEEMVKPEVPFDLSAFTTKEKLPTKLADVKEFTSNGASGDGSAKPMNSFHDSIALAHAKVFAAAVKYHVRIGPLPSKQKLTLYPGTATSISRDHQVSGHRGE